MPFQGVKFQKFSGGACPRNPLDCALPCFDVPSKIPGSAPEHVKVFVAAAILQL